MWKACFCSLLMFVKYCENVQENNEMSFIPRRNVLNIISELIEQPPSQSTVPTGASDVQSSSKSVTMKSDLEIRTEKTTKISEFELEVDGAEIDVTDRSPMEIDDLQVTRPPFPPPPGHLYPVQHASVPQGLAVMPVPLPQADHELLFNVTWLPGLGAPARDYSLEVRSVKDTPDCNTPMCYEYNIPGESRWWTIPALRHPVTDTCAVKPGCAYRVRLIAHPWDGHTSANLLVELDECVAGVCSCAHAPRLPTPAVSAQMLSIEGELFANVTWWLPPPSNPLRLPRGLQKQFYFLSIGKQMVSDAHPSPWYAHTVSRKVTSNGLVNLGDSARWFLLPLQERAGEKDKVGDKQKVMLNVKLLARVSLIDDRGCFSPAGNATAFDPNKSQPVPVSTYALWSALGGACVLAMVAVIAGSSQAMKRVLRTLRSSPISDPHEPRSRNAWFPLHLHTNEVPSRGQVEQSPLYTHKEFEPPDELLDSWEVRRSRIQLGALIGSGAFGRVHAAQLAMPGGETVVVAAKMLGENATEDEMQDFQREITMLKHVGYHKHVIRLIGCCSTRAPLIVLLEHAPRGDLLSLLRAARGRKRDGQGSNVTRRADSDNNRRGDSEGTRRADSGSVRPSEEESEYTNLSDSDPTLHEGKLYLDDYKGRNKDHYVAEPVLLLDGSTMRDYALQVALGMSHLEERGITHRDLAARNILVDGAGVLKVADFGLSRCGVYVHTRARPVPLRWLAPEAILHSQYSSASDVWAFAVLLWEIATLGGFPYAELSNHQVPTFLTGGGRLPKPVRASPRLYELMVHCWTEDFQHRPTFAQLVDKLQAQKQLYVDLDSVLSHDEEFSDGDFSMNSAEWANDR